MVKKLRMRFGCGFGRPIALENCISSVKFRKATAYLLVLNFMTSELKQKESVQIWETDQWMLVLPTPLIYILIHNHYSLVYIFTYSSSYTIKWVV